MGEEKKDIHTHRVSVPFIIPVVTAMPGISGRTTFLYEYYEKALCHPLRIGYLKINATDPHQVNHG